MTTTLFTLLKSCVRTAVKDLCNTYVTTELPHLALVQLGQSPGKSISLHTLIQDYFRGAAVRRSSTLVLRSSMAAKVIGEA